MELFPEKVTDNTGLSHRPRENHILDLHRYVCRGDGVCGGHGDGARLQFKGHSDTILYGH